MAWAYKGTITITGSSTLLPSTQTNFPVLVKLDSVNCTVSAVNRIKTTANGGAVNNTGTQSGGNAVTMPFDLAFYSDSGLTTKIPWEVESYDGTGGTLWVWVLMASCALSGNLYFGLGDAAVNSQQNTAGNAPSAVWDSNYAAVYHLPSTTVKDSTGNANDASSNTATATTGEIDGGGAYGGTGSTVTTIPTSTSLNFAGAVTMEAWVFPTISNAYQCMIARTSAANVRQYSMFLSALGTGNIFVGINGLGGGANYAVTPAWTVNAWNHIVVAANGAGSKTIYINGVAANTSSANDTAVTASASTYLGYDGQAASFGLNGSLDECRVSIIARSANYVTATYNAHLTPQTFASVSLAAVAGGSSSSLFRPSSLAGLGSGGSFFQNPLG